MNTAPEGRSRAALLASGLAELKLEASVEVQARLLGYLDMLGKWNRHYNLTAIRDAEVMLSHHLLDCLSTLPALDRYAHSLSGQVRRAPLRLLDAGSGAGLPGVVLALMRPDWFVTCVDTVGKKAGFVRQVASELPVPNLTSAHSRVEQLKLPAFDIVMSRAFASLSDFVRLTQSQLSPGGRWVAMKGKLPSAEMAALPAHVNVFHVEQLQVPGLDAERMLVWMGMNG